MDKRIPVLVGLIVMMFLVMSLPVQALHDPDGTQANSGTLYDGEFIAWVTSGYDSSVWTYVSCYDYYGDLYISGTTSQKYTNHYLDYYCVIKIKPADSSHKYLEISTDAWFHYGLSCGWFLSSASWSLEYVVMNMDQTPYREGFADYSLGDSAAWPNQIENAHKQTSSSYYSIYTTIQCSTLKEFSTDTWYYVGIHITANLGGDAEFYRYDWHNGQAWFNPASISWQFYE
jgi:hypothetical protein